jgi:hypothetical protein
MDVGAAFRHAAAWAWRHGALRPGMVWPAAVLAGCLGALTKNATLHVVLGALFFAGFGVAVTNARASYTHARRHSRWRMIWLLQAGMTAVAAFVVSGLLSLRADNATATLSFSVVTLAPLGVLMAVATAAQRRVPDPQPAMRKTVIVGTGAAAGTVAYLVLQFLLTPMGSPEVPVREIIAAGASVLVVGALREPLRALSRRILAEPQPRLRS